MEREEICHVFTEEVREGLSYLIRRCFSRVLENSGKQDILFSDAGEQQVQGPVARACLVSSRSISGA